MSPNLSVCVIGAGPAGLAAARALRAFQIPYIQLERNHQVGGIWDINAPGGPMYESAHFISSKTVSAYPQFPMPEHYPDYPSHRQIFQYLNEFADHYGLREGVEFGAEVTAVTKNLDNTWLLVMRRAALLKRTCRCAEATGSFRNISSANQWMSSPPADPSYHFGSSRRSLRKC